MNAVSNARRSSIPTALTLGNMWRSDAADTHAQEDRSFDPVADHRESDP